VLRRLLKFWQAFGVPVPARPLPDVAQGEEPGKPGSVAGMGGQVLMTTAASGAYFEIKIGGVVRTHRDDRDSAVEAARFLQQRNPGAKIAITDLRDGSNIPHDRSA
jgi:hypothetical protein